MYMQEFDLDRLLGGMLGEMTKGMYPATDIRSFDDRYVIEMDVPGFSKEDVNIEVRDHRLRISSEKKFPREGKYIAKGRILKSFSHIYSIPDGVDEEKITAGMKDGVLTVTAPKTQKEEPKAVSVKIG